MCCLFYPFTPSSLITPLSFGEGSGVRLFLSFGEGLGVRLFVLSKFMFQPQAAKPTGLFACPIRPIRVRFKNHLQSRVRLLLRVLGAIRVRHTPAAKPTGLFAVIRMISVL